jgi:RimJ/RimL family protein N-acetyltransferase
MVLVLRPQALVAGLGYWLIPSPRGLGYASRAVTLLTDGGLFPDGGGFERIEAWVEPNNDRRHGPTARSIGAARRPRKERSP